MYGAFIGDYCGSAYEYSNLKNYHFNLFPSNANFTDDTVLTLAIADALNKINTDKDDLTIRTIFAKSLKEWYQKYPNLDYGINFRKWCESKTLLPYNSYGNGAAMRVSSIGWAYDNLYLTKHIARLSAMATHNHIEGIKGAECIASIIFLLRKQILNKEEIKFYIQFEYGYDLNQDYETLKNFYEYDITCRGTVLAAIICFLQSNSFEDCLRKAISLGGDADTLGCIAGSIAEAYYSIPINFKEKINKELKNLFDF